MKHFLRNLIIVVLVCSAFVYVALHIDFDKEKNISGEKTNIGIDEEYFSVPFNLGDFLYKDIYINGKHINNWNLVDPFVTVEGQIFVPMSESVLECLGLSLEFDDAKHHVVFTPTEGPSMQGIHEGLNVCNLQYLEVYWGHKYYFGDVLEEEIMAATTKGKKADSSRVLYVSLPCLQKYSGLDITYYYDDISGIYISTVKDVDAKSQYSENNAKFIEGRARFMMEKSSTELDLETALFYEYIFRHESSMYECMDEDLLMGICMVESRFNTKAESRAGAIGLLQILYKYAEKSDYSEEMLKDPHYNVEYATASLADGYARVGGDKLKWLTAYNMGYYAMKSRLEAGLKLNTSYADKCIYWEDMIKLWVNEKGYSENFYEL